MPYDNRVSVSLIILVEVVISPGQLFLLINKCLRFRGTLTFPLKDSFF